jgi:hypothetical protein
MRQRNVGRVDENDKLKKDRFTPISRRSQSCYDLIMAQGVLRFFFDYGAGGCLWTGNAATRDRLDAGPVDAASFDLDSRVRKPARVELSETAQTLWDQLDFEHSVSTQCIRLIQACGISPSVIGSMRMWTDK